jgi:signal transduction histidine kinase
MANQMQADITVESQEKEGSTFHLILRRTRE